MDKIKAKDLLEKYRSGNLTNEEQALLESWYIDWPLDDELDLSEAAIQNELQQIRSAIPYLKTGERRIKVWPLIAAAASIIILLSVGSYIYFKDKATATIARQDQAGKGILPGTNKAVLTLANGRNINLTDTGRGELAKELSMHITKSGNNQIAYSALTNVKDQQNTKLIYNTLTTPRGGQYNVILADGTRVWLNAASSIRYPTSFNNQERRVMVTGEAYFEVAHNKSKPFRVITNGQTVEVLGTHFNINAYGDEPGIKTTLLEGSVKVFTAKASSIIKPGEETLIRTDRLEERISVYQVNAEQAIAWKNGLFQFKNADIETVMRSLARWYNVQVVYKGDISKRKFSGDIYRNVNLLQALDILNYSGIHSRLEVAGGANGQGKIIVTS